MEEDIKDMQDVNSKWLIQETYVSAECRHKTKSGNCEEIIVKTFPLWIQYDKCEKHKCPIRVK